MSPVKRNRLFNDIFVQLDQDAEEFGHVNDSDDDPTTGETELPPAKRRKVDHAGARSAVKQERSKTMAEVRRMDTKHQIVHYHGRYYYLWCQEHKVSFSPTLNVLSQGRNHLGLHGMRRLDMNAIEIMGIQVTDCTLSDAVEHNKDVFRSAVSITSNWPSVFFFFGCPFLSGF